MTCAECEALSLFADEGSAAEAAEVFAHLEGCSHCRAEAEQARAALELAALPPLSAAERAQLAPLAASALSAWRGRERQRGLWRTVAGFAAAAAFGGLVTSAALLGKDPAPLTRSGGAIALEEPAVLAAGEPEAADDELDAEAWEVPWNEEPDTLEGEAP